MLEIQGMETLLAFWKEKYLEEYIPNGGSKIKFVTGRPGSGKTYFLNALREEAKKDNYITVHFTAKKLMLNDFREIYLEILNQVNIEERLQECANAVILQMGDHPESIDEGKNYIDYLARQNRATILNKKQIRDELQNMFLENPHLDNNFAIACSVLTAGILGYPALDEQGKNIYLGWLKGDKSLNAPTLRAAGLLPTKITKYNARHMMRSLAEVIHLGGKSGLFVTIDDLDVMQDETGLQEIHYTKLRRDDTYESIREMIDEIDTMHYIMFVFGFNRALIDNEKLGFKSYSALWMRIQNEVISDRFNCFTDIADLDQLAGQMYTPDYILTISQEMSNAAKERTMKPMTYEEAQMILEKSKYGSSGVARLIQEEMFKDGDEHD